MDETDETQQPPSQPAPAGPGDGHPITEAKATAVAALRRMVDAVDAEIKALPEPQTGGSEDEPITGARSTLWSAWGALMAELRHLER